jgi:hypothetical protein
MDGDDSDISLDEKEEARGLGGKVPLQGAPTRGPRPQGSSALSEERAGLWPLGPSEMMVLRGTSSVAARPERPGESLTLLVGGGDSSEKRVVPLGASVAALVVGAVGKSPSWEVPPPPPQRTEEVATAVGGRPLAHGAPVSPDLGSSKVEASVALPPPPPPPPQ